MEMFIWETSKVERHMGRGLILGKLQEKCMWVNGSKGIDMAMVCGVMLLGTGLKGSGSMGEQKGEEYSSGSTEINMKGYGICS